MISVSMAVLVAAAVIAIFLTMGPGQRLVQRLGIRRLQKGAAPDEDRAYLLRACGDDRAAVEARLASVRERYPDWAEAQLYRAAIRAVMNESAAAGDDTKDMKDTNDSATNAAHSTAPRGETKR